MITKLWNAIRQPFRRETSRRPFVAYVRDARWDALNQSRESIKATRQTMRNLPSPNFMEAELLGRRDSNE